MTGLIKHKNNIAQVGSNLKSLALRYRSYPRNIKAFLLNVIFSSLGSGIYEVLISLYLLSIGYSETFVGLFFSIGAISLGLFAIPAGIISDKIGRKTSFIISRIGMIISLFLLITFVNSVVILLSIALFNIFQVFYIVSSAPFIVEVVPMQHRVRVSSIIFFTSFIAMTVGNLLSGTLSSIYGKTFSVSQNSPQAIRFSLYFYIILLIISLISILRIREIPKTKIESVSSFLRLSDLNLKNFSFLKGIIVVLIAATIVNLGASFILPFFPIYFKSRFNISTQYIGLLFSLSNIPLAFASLLNDKIVKRFGMNKSIALCQFLGAPFALLMGFPLGFHITYFAFVMRKIFLNFYGPIWDNFLMGLVRSEDRGKALAFINLSINIFSGIGTAISGYFFKANLYLYPFLIASICTFIAALIYYNYKPDNSALRFQ
ncbi:MAG: MFS transporter [Caldisericia bacterium]|nr:MFS transporter [Caldisericia bacterium]